MSYSLEQLVNVYRPQLNYNDEQIIVLFHSCIIKKGFIVVGEVNNYHFFELN